MVYKRDHYCVIWHWTGAYDHSISRWYF